MKIIANENGKYILRLDKEEELLTELSKFCESNKISSAFFSAIGSVNEAILSYYDLQSKAYEDNTIKASLEILNISGNITHLNDKPVIHAHGVLGKRDLSTIGGHIKKLVISATCEVVMHRLNTTVTRQIDYDTRLNLLK